MFDLNKVLLKYRKIISSLQVLVIIEMKETVILLSKVNVMCTKKYNYLNHHEMPD